MGSRMRRRPGMTDSTKDTWELTVDLERDASGRQRRRVVMFRGTKTEAKTSRPASTSIPVATRSLVFSSDGCATTWCPTPLPRRACTTSRSSIST